MRHSLSLSRTHTRARIVGRTHHGSLRSQRHTAKGSDVEQVVQGIDNLLAELTKYRRLIEDKAQLPSR